jgi:hypothetical protein
MADILEADPAWPNGEMAKVDLPRGPQRIQRMRTSAARISSMPASILFGKVRGAVRRKTNRRQEPFLYGSLGGDQHFFASSTPR